MVRAMLLAALTAASPTVTLVAPPAPAPSPPVSVGHPWGWPLEPRPAVVRHFRTPPTPWSAGHRGVDLAGRAGQLVLAAGAGQVTFSGVVAGRGVVVVTHPGGLRTSYEPLQDRSPTGTDVGVGTPVGVLDTTSSHCAPASCLHWGLREGSTYLDPLLLLGAQAPVLLPLAGVSRP